MSTFVLMAGGTGGHLFPAMALAEELRRRGHDIHLMTDHRVRRYGDGFPARRVHIIPSATPSVRNPVKFVAAASRLAWGVAVAMRELPGIHADAAVAFGGYPVFPPFVAASLLGIPGILHEQNTVMGRANRALCRFASVIALSFDNTAKVGRWAHKALFVGNPVGARDRVRAVADVPYPDIGDRLRLLVVGGSQGARAFADLVPPAIAALPPEMRSKMRVTQQCRPEDLDRVAEAYRQSKVNVELSAFFDDLPERMAQSHLVIARSGASTITELGVIGRPAILVPLPGSLDADQSANARLFEAAGAGWMVEQATLSPESLGTRIAGLFAAPESLQEAAVAAKALGRPRAVEVLAELAEQVARKGKSK